MRTGFEEEDEGEGKREEYDEECQWNLRQMIESGGEENLAEKQEGETKKCQPKLKEKGPYFQIVPLKRENAEDNLAEKG